MQIGPLIKSAAWPRPARAGHAKLAAKVAGGPGGAASTQKVSTMPALASAALRRAIQSSVNFAASDDGPALLKSFHAEIRTACRLNSSLLYFSCSSLQAPASFSALTAPLCAGTAQFLVCVATASPLAPGALSL